LLVVDPHDGTSASLAGERGSSVSIALLRDGVPVLGVVHAPRSPDRGPDTIDHLPRNGTLIARMVGAVVLAAAKDAARRCRGGPKTGHP
jgi:3'-phosphoadenosine 5'-phosphosulfate (PAPS) 3'-phosphatase